MSTHRIHDQKHTAYFVTFTCHKWLPLIDLSNSYSSFQKWFEYLNSKNASVLGYVIMPNHFHGLIFLDEKCDKSLNQLVANGKRFMAYDIVKGLRLTKQGRVLDLIAQSVTIKERLKGKKHQVFIASFDAKECFSRSMIETKLDYIHHNPVKGKWSLCEDWANYPYSSASFYELNKPNPLIRHYMDVI